MSPAETLTLKHPEQLYLDWEHAHWASQDVDLSRDPPDWSGLEEEERNLLYFALSSLMVAEEGSRRSSSDWSWPRTTRRRGAICRRSWSTRSATCSSTPVSRTR
jgi:ribonucleotide reductase beta subunit family protein with ferritin-like domain